MDIFLLLIGFIFICLGIVGSFLPILPGPPTGWIGLLLLYLTKSVPDDWTFLWSTLAVALLVTLLDYIIPPLGTKKFGGTKYGIWGSTIGLIIGLFFGPIGIIAGPFLGAYAGEILHNSKDTSKAFKAALGSFIGFLFSTALKLVVGIVFLTYFIKTFWEYKSNFFTF